MVLCGHQYEAWYDRIAWLHCITWYLDGSYSFVTHLAPCGIHSWWQGTSMSMVAIATWPSSVFVYRCPFLTWRQGIRIGRASDLSLRVTPPWSVSVGNVWRWWMALRVNLRIIYSWLQLKQSPVEGDLLLELPVAAVILFMVMGYCSWRAINFLMSPWKG